MERENQRVKLTKRMLQEGLLRLLDKKQLDKINITELCNEAGINRITFYRHYETPRDILLEMERELLGELRRSFRMPGSLQDIRQIMEDACNYLDTNIELIKVMILNNTDSEFCLLFHDFFREIYIDRQNSVIREKIDPDSLEILAICSAGSSYFLIRQWLLGNVKKTPKEIVSIFYDQLFGRDGLDLSKNLGLM